jgi:hypothetical protein
MADPFVLLRSTVTLNRHLTQLTLAFLGDSGDPDRLLLDAAAVERLSVTELIPPDGGEERSPSGRCEGE